MRQFVRLVCILVGVGAVYGVFFGVGFGATSVSAILDAVAIGIINVVIAGSSIVVLQLFVLRPGLIPWLDAQPLVAVIALKTLIYGAITAAVTAGQPGEHLMGVATRGDARTAAITIGVSLVTVAVMVTMFQAAALLGGRTFVDLMRGKYRQPRAERRFLLFVDVIGSTTIAERLGPLDAHRFLATVFGTLAEPIELCHGEIHQYVGDEIVVTWFEDDGVRDARALRCIFEMRAALAAGAPQFRERFGVEPELRAALHFGELIAGEIGVVRRSIVFHGDVMNTAARLEQATRETGCRFIASADALAALGPLPGAQTHDLGALALRGRVEAIRAFCVEGVDRTSAA
jgi:adenylate cyclase